jgi:DNA replication protein DnaC
LPQKSGEILLEIIIRRYENRSTMMTSNRPIEEWGKLMPLSTQKSGWF